ncbi:hypothetical protein [Mesorhizobium sp. WSM2561]|uniref:hypothetical protein n=1 Tax=Mesorhizobium sp. WSM2561 TaxID=1040985 RepID=UPI000485570E|nr:hypothetical protein [Mesorhizobium sp. WSM2561]
MEDTPIVKTQPQTRAQFAHLRDDANILLAYAAEAGIEVGNDVAQPIIAATQKGDDFWNGNEVGAFLSAITKLAAKLRPVTAGTLRACQEDASFAIRGYKRLVYTLAVFIVPISIITFISAGISNVIKANLEVANSAVVTLHAKLSTTKPGEATNGLLDLQQFAVAARAVKSRSDQLNYTLLGTIKHKDLDDDFEVRPNIIDRFEPVKEEVSRLTSKYQNVRFYANNVLDSASIVWGAVTASILPVLYALLGACAAVLRAFTQHYEARTFSRSYATPARFIIAGIGGGIIGLFGNLDIGKGLTPSPLALAFLVGYAADIFFSLLEGSIPASRVPQRPAATPGS